MREITFWFFFVMKTVIRVMQRSWCWRLKQGFQRTKYLHLSLSHALSLNFCHHQESDLDHFVCVCWWCKVSNWFINARVRLWKPMIEEMYREEFGDSSDESMQREGNDDSNWLIKEQSLAPSNSIFWWVCYSILHLLYVYLNSFQTPALLCKLDRVSSLHLVLVLVDISLRILILESALHNGVSIKYT